MRARVHYLETTQKRDKAVVVRENLSCMKASPIGYASALWYVLHNRLADAGYAASSRFDCFQQAVYLSQLMQEEACRTGVEIDHLHAHFAHDPTLIAYLVHKLTGISFSFTAHARDLYQVPASEIIERASQASAVITCCQANVQYLQTVLPKPLHSRVRLIHHGVDLDGFSASPAAARPSPTPLILSVGRLVEKKGYFDLLQACLSLQQRGCDFRCEIYGDGPLCGELSEFIHQNGLSDRVLLEGARTQPQLLEIYQRAAVFALTPLVTEDGDRDGIPNVIIEAMASGLPVVTTNVGGIPELVIHEQNGLLYEPCDVPSIAAGLSGLLGDPRRREQLGSMARRSIAEGFDVRRTARQMLDLFDTIYHPQSIFCEAVSL